MLLDELSRSLRVAARRRREVRPAIEASPDVVLDLVRVDVEVLRQARAAIDALGVVVDRQARGAHVVAPEAARPHVHLLEPPADDRRFGQELVGLILPTVHPVEDQVVEVELHPRAARFLGVLGGLLLLGRLLHLLHHGLHLRGLLRVLRLLLRQLRRRRFGRFEHLDPDHLIAADQVGRRLGREGQRTDRQQRRIDIGPIAPQWLALVVLGALLGRDVETAIGAIQPVLTRPRVDAPLAHRFDAEIAQHPVLQQVRDVAIRLREFSQTVERVGRRVVGRLAGGDERLGLGRRDSLDLARADAARVGVSHAAHQLLSPAFLKQLGNRSANDPERCIPGRTFPIRSESARHMDRGRPL